MGGIVFIAATVIAYLVTHVVVGEQRISPTAVTLLGLFVGMGLVGFVDDFIKIRKRRSLGLNKRGKLIGQAVVAVGFAFLALNLPDENGYTIASERLSLTRDISWAHLTQVGAALFFALVVIATANGVNITDGLDGLATGPSIMVLAGYLLIGLWQSRHICADFTGQPCYTVRDPLETALLAAAAAGALAGFLWWNAPPARLFMGDTGALGIGGLIAGLALTTRTTLLLPLLGGLFVIVTLSVVIQIVSFRSTGHRIFRMAPLQHHFELAGWPETTIVVRFWVVAGVFVAAGLSVFFADYLEIFPL